jgi:hypothetical protein
LRGWLWCWFGQGANDLGWNSLGGNFAAEDGILDPLNSGPQITQLLAHLWQNLLCDVLWKSWRKALYAGGQFGGELLRSGWCDLSKLPYGINRYILGHTKTLCNIVCGIAELLGLQGEGFGAKESSEQLCALLHGTGGWDATGRGAYRAFHTR